MAPLCFVIILDTTNHSRCQQNVINCIVDVCSKVPSIAVKCLQWQQILLPYRIRFTFENGSALAFGAALDAASGAPNTFQNLSVSSAAADATVQPSGL